MSRFYVGQRVRVVKSQHNRAVGFEAVIAAPSDIGQDWLVRIGGLPSDHPDRLWSVYDWQLEPITDSYDVTTWDACVWKPEHLRVEA